MIDNILLKIEKKKLKYNGIRKENNFQKKNYKYN